jgi:hypothetical protein
MPPSFDSSFETTPARNSDKTRSMIVRTSCVPGTDRQATFRQAELGGRNTAPCRAIGCECQRPIAVASFRPLDPLVCFAVSKNGPRPRSRAPSCFRMISHGLDGMTRTRIPRDYESAALPIELRQPRGAFRRFNCALPRPLINERRENPDYLYGNMGKFVKHICQLGRNCHSMDRGLARTKRRRIQGADGEN